MSRWRRWVALLDTREAPTSLALVRIACGVVVALHLVHMLTTGAADWVWVDRPAGGLRTLDPGWLARLGGLTAPSVHRLVLGTALAAACMAAGLLTRLSTFLTWLGFGFLADLNDQAGGSYDELLKNTLFLLLLSGAGGALSLDARLGRGRRAVPAWPRYLMIFQLALMYWMTGLHKVSSSWVPLGESDALFYILQQPTWQRFPLSPSALLSLYPLTRLGTACVWAWEQAAPLLLLAFYYRATRERPGRLRAFFNRVDFRKWYLLVGLALHAGIELLIEVGPFSYASVTLYLACVHPDEWRARSGPPRAPTRAAAAGG